VRITLDARETASGSVRVEVAAHGEGLERWAAMPPKGAELSALSARDARGPLEVREELEDGALLVTFDRAPVPPLSLTYTLGAPTAFDARLFISTSQLLLTVKTLLLPADESAHPFHLDVALDPRWGHRVATGLGPGATHDVTAHAAELRDVVVLAGNLETGSFVTRAGRDETAVLGGPLFDPRWAAAEAGLIRSWVDEALGRVSPNVFPLLIFVREARPLVPPVVVERSGLGARMVVVPGEPWSARIRLPLAQVLARRWLGGVLRFEAGDWLSLGVTRFIAIRALLDMNLATPEETIDELERLEGDVALGAEGPRGAMARGALYAARLSLLLSRRNEAPRTLRDFFAPLFAEAEGRTGAALEERVFIDHLRATLGDDEVTAFGEAIRGDGVVALVPESFGRCFVVRRTMHRRFALGFEAPDPERDGTHAITALVEGGPAAGAGLREGDIIRELRYVPGDPNTGVDVSVERDGSVRAIRFMPTDRSTPGRGWRRNPAVPDEECTF
jgi:hypothetical protein